MLLPGSHYPQTLTTRDLGFNLQLTGRDLYEIRYKLAKIYHDWALRQEAKVLAEIEACETPEEEHMIVSIYDGPMEGDDYAFIIIATTVARFREYCGGPDEGKVTLVQLEKEIDTCRWVATPCNAEGDCYQNDEFYRTEGLFELFDLA